MLKFAHRAKGRVSHPRRGRHFARKLAVFIPLYSQSLHFGRGKIATRISRPPGGAIRKLRSIKTNDIFKIITTL